jgi:PadR family transcriptional regulator, regulatory protein PadR
MADLPRLTLNVLRILKVLADNPTTPRHGLEIGLAAGLRGGSLYPVLSKLEDAKLVTSIWEDVDPSEVGRPRRRLYQLNPDGLVYARQTLAEAQQHLSPADQHAPAWGHTPGFPARGGAPA